jgi:hypothetical protein
VTETHTVSGAALDHQVYRVALGWLDHFDAVTGGITPGVNAGISSVAPNSMPANLVVTLDIELDPSFSPPSGSPLMVWLKQSPSVNVPAYSSSRTGNTVSAEFSLVGLSPGTYDVEVEFGLGDSYARQGGFIVQ